METTQVMVPGILVALRTSVHGGVSYDREILNEAEDGSYKEFHTVKRIIDPKERRKAGETAGQASRLISKLCIRTSFGLLCPVEREGELDTAVARMRQIVREFNANTRYSYITVSAIKGRIAENDEEAVRAVVEEATTLLEQMNRGITDADVKAIREAAGRAKNLGEMLNEDTAATVTAAVAAARTAARMIVKRGEAIGDKVINAMIEKAGDDFNAARFTFMETMDEAGVAAVPSVDLDRIAGIEVDDEPEPEAKPKPKTRRSRKEVA